MKDLQYKKRSGTSGVSGQLYETKLISLILFRALHDDDIEEFYIGTNVDGIGEFDDICFRFKVKGFDKPVAVFLQAKHRDNQNKALTITEGDLMKYFDSCLKIRNKFNVNSSDVFFKGTYDDVECVFVYYTNTKDQLPKINGENNVNYKINDIFGTGDMQYAFQLSYTDKDIDLLNKVVLRGKIKKIGAVIANLVKNKGDNYENLMNDEQLQTFHVILAQHVFNISDVQEGHRFGRFKSEFLDTKDEHLLALKESMLEENHLNELKTAKFDEILNDSKPEKEPTNGLLRRLFNEPSELIISKLIGGVIKYYINNKIEFIDKLKNTDNNLREELDSVNVTETLIAQAVAIVEREVLRTAEFKLPTAFGNNDMTLRGSDLKKDKRLNYLSNNIVELLKESKERDVNNKKFNIVNIKHNATDKGFLQLNGGIAGAVGNLFILDETTRLLMFAKRDELRGYARRLFDKINSKIEDLETYRFVVKVEHFPRLVFDYNESNEDLVADFTNKLLFYTNQATESTVERILNEEISQHNNSRVPCDFQIYSDVIFKIYHHEIQKWWMKQGDSHYLTKTTLLFQNATNNANIIINNRLIIANECSKYRFINKNIKFDPQVVNTFKFNESCSKITLIDSEVIDLSVIKLTQYFKVSDYIVIDFDYILSLPENLCRRLETEIKNVKDKIFILTCKNSSLASNISKWIKDVLRTLDGKRLIIVTNNESVQEIRTYFARKAIDIIHDTCSLVDLTKESQDFIFEKTNVIFQGEGMRLNMLLDDESKVFIKGKQLDKIMKGETILIGAQLTDSWYELIKDFYVSRKLTKNQSPTAFTVLKTFYDVDDHPVVIAAEPGMGKSCLLTHLSLATKTRDPTVWIVRINLLDYSKIFYLWKENKAVIDVLEALRFICITLVNQDETYKIILNEDNGNIFLNGCKNLSEAVEFYINMFLHFCNRRNVIFLFDGFDEICPYYKKEVITLLKVIKNYRTCEHRIWITSRTNNETLCSLKKEFGDFYQFEPWSITELEIFISKFLQSKFNFNELTAEQIDTINDFMTFTAQCVCVPTGPHGPMSTVYYFAALFFKNQISNAAVNFKNKEKYIRQWVLNVSTNPKLLNVCELIKVPLHIYIAADYFQNEIKYFKTNQSWDLKINTLMMYERFVETKFKKIRFEEKNKIDIYKPDNRLKFERERREFFNTHKRLGAYATFVEYKDELFNEAELKEIEDTINSIKLGEEKSDVVDSVVNQVPRFIHKTFAEYFAVEYICDLLKAARSKDDFTITWKFLMKLCYNKYMDVFRIFDIKLEIDEALKRAVYEEHRRVIILEDLLDVGWVASDNAVYPVNPIEFFEHVCPNLNNLFRSSIDLINIDDHERVDRFRLDMMFGFYYANRITRLERLRRRR